MSVLSPLRIVSVALLVAAFAGPRLSRAETSFSEQGATVLNGANFESRSASLADIDDDGDLDLFFQGSTGAQRLFRNDFIPSGTLAYTNISDTLPSGIGLSWSAAWGDYNGDGRIDVFVGQTNSGSNRGDVLRNDGAAGFSNQSNATGLNDPGFHQNVAWADIDRDRDLDLLIGMEGPEKHEIYLQGAGGNFTAAGAAAGFQTAIGYKGYGMAIGDTDGDGDLDVYISTCDTSNNIRNNFYENRLAQTGTLSFVDIADSNGTQNTRNTYHSEFVDLDDDGDLDLYLVGADRQLTKIYRNDGGNQFTDIDTVTGHPVFADVGSDYNGGRAVDYDNDGDLDLFVHDHLALFGKDYARKLFRNDGEWTFTDVTDSVGIGAFNEGAYDSTWGDLDNDGDLDLVAPTDSFSDERIFLSDASTNGNHWLFVRLDGQADNTTGIGASLYATINAGTPQERTLRREANTNAGTFNQSDLPVHFGLGAADSIDELRVVWPDGTVQTLFDVEVDQYMTIAAPQPLPGDYNTDGVVDAADYVVWRDQLGHGVRLPNDDTAGVGSDDYTRWKNNFGATAGAGAVASVPEPAAWMMVLVASAASMITRSCGTRRGVRRSFPARS